MKQRKVGSWFRVNSSIQRSFMSDGGVCFGSEIYIFTIRGKDLAAFTDQRLGPGDLWIAFCWLYFTVHHTENDNRESSFINPSLLFSPILEIISLVPSRLYA